MNDESGPMAARQIPGCPSGEGGQGAAPAPEGAPAAPKPPPGSTRKPRADAQRNREKLLAAAAAIFAQGGPEASLEAVARRANGCGGSALT